MVGPLWNLKCVHYIGLVRHCTLILTWDSIGIPLFSKISLLVKLDSSKLSFCFIPTAHVFMISSSISRISSCNSFLCPFPFAVPHVNVVVHTESLSAYCCHAYDDFVFHSCLGLFYCILYILLPTSFYLTFRSLLYFKVITCLAVVNLYVFLNYFNCECSFDPVLYSPVLLQLLSTLNHLLKLA